MLGQFGEIQSPDSLAAELGDQYEDAEDEAKIADAVDDKRFVAGNRIVVLAVPKADQQVRTQSDAFPADEKQQQVVAHHQRQHEKNKQIEINEEPDHVIVMAHVTQRIDVNQKADAGDDQQHHRGQRIDLKRQVDLERAGLNPGIERIAQNRARRHLP